MKIKTTVAPWKPGDGLPRARARIKSLKARQRHRELIAETKAGNRALKHLLARTGVVTPTGRRLEAEYKAANDQRLADLRRKRGDTLHDVKLRAMDRAVDREDREIKRLRAENKRLKTVAGRPALGGVSGMGGQDAHSDAVYNAAVLDYLRHGTETYTHNGQSYHLKKVTAERQQRLFAKMSAQGRKAAETLYDPGGGFAVLREGSDSLIDARLSEYSPMRQWSETITVGKPNWHQYYNLGGGGGRWAREGDPVAATGTPKLGKIEWTVQKLEALPEVTNEMLEDAFFDVEAWLTDGALESQDADNPGWAELESSGFLRGNGVNQPKGLLSYDMVANASWEHGKFGFVTTGSTTGFASLNTHADDGADVAPGDCLIDLVHSLQAPYRQGSQFYMSDTTMAAVRKLKDADGQYYWERAYTADAPATLMGYPVMVDTYWDAIAENKYPIAFGKMNETYLIVDRAGVNVLRDPYSRKGYVQFYMTKRVGGGAKLFNRLKFLKVAA